MILFGSGITNTSIFFLLQNASIILSPGPQIDFQYFRVQQVSFLTTNFTIAGYDDSDRRRLNEIEIVRFYKPDFTPYDDFGHNLLTEDWDDEQWNLFYNLMLFCISYYLCNGLLTYKQKYLPYNKIISETSLEFLNIQKNFKLGKDYNKNEEYYDYITKYSQVQIKKNMFTRWLKLFAEVANWHYIESSGPQNKYKKFRFTKQIDFRSTNNS